MPGESSRSQSGGLSNKDFRTLMMTPRPGGAVNLYTSSEPSDSSQEIRTRKIRAPESEDDAYRRNVKREQRQKWKQMQKEKEDEKAQQPKYRDRAMERRTDKNPDYEDVSYQPSAVLDTKKVIEQSKYLGGDLEHTHLVKGLDFVLLDKTRKEMESKSKNAEQPSEAEQLQVGAFGSTITSTSTEAAADIQFCTPLGRKVHQILFSSPSLRPKARSEAFLKGRTAYVYRLDEEMTQELPTTIVRSKAECPSANDLAMSSQVDRLIMEKISKIMNYLRVGASRTRAQKKKAKEVKISGKDAKKIVEPSRSEVSTADDSIYPDVGDYVFQPKAAVDNSGSSYFAEESQPTMSSSDLSRDDQTRMLIAQAQVLAHKAEHNKIDDATTGDGKEEIAPSTVSAPTQPKKDAKEKKPSQESEDYAECYPGTYEVTSFVMDDEEEDEDLSKMDQGPRQRHKLRRWDFDSEERWEKYVQTREQLPRAAFQFGIKMANGRKTRKQKDMKLHREMKKINETIRRREDGDDRNSKRRRES